MEDNRKRESETTNPLNNSENSLISKNYQKSENSEFLDFSDFFRNSEIDSEIGIDIEIKNSPDRNRKRGNYSKVTDENFSKLKKLIDEKESTKEICRMTGLAKRTVQYWKKELFNNSDRTPEKRGLKPKINTERRREIELLISANKYLTAVDIAKMMPEYVKCSTTTIKRELKSMGYSRIRLNQNKIEKNSENIIMDRFKYCSEITVVEDENLVFIEETGFNLHDSRNYGYSFSSESPIKIPAQKEWSLSVLCAVTINGCLSFKVEKGGFCLDPVKNWVMESLIPSLKKNSIIIINSDTIRQFNVLESIFKNEGFQVKILPQLSIELNPIEEFFGLIRNVYNKTTTPKPSTLEEMAERINDIFLEYYNHNLQKFFSNMRDWVLKGTQKINFL